MKNAKKILLVTKKDPDLDTYLSLQLLAEVIKQDLGTEVEIGCDAELPSRFTTEFPITGIKTLNQLPPKNFVLEFSNQNNKVKNVQWNQNAEKLVLYLTMEQGNLNTDNLNFNINGSNYDLIIILGVNTIVELGNIYQNAQAIFNETQVIVFGSAPQIKLPKVRIAENASTSSISEQVFTYLQQNGVKISQPRAQKLLTGIFSAIDGFNKNVKDPATFTKLAELTKLGATNAPATTLLKKLKPSEAKPETQASTSAPKPAAAQPSDNQPKKAEPTNESTNKQPA